MPITKRTDYAIRIMFELARLDYAGRATAREIADEGGMPYEFARAIITELVANGLLVSRRGIGGGVELARPASRITLWEIVSAIEPQMCMSECTVRPDVCDRSGWCPTHLVWGRLDEVIADELRSVTLEELRTQVVARTRSTAV